MLNRSARNEEEITALMAQADRREGNPAGGTSYHDGVKAALDWVHGGRHPYEQAAPNPAGALPAEAVGFRAAPNPPPTGAGAGPTNATGATGVGAVPATPR